MAKDSATTTPYNYSDRYLNNGLGILEGSSNRGEWSKKEILSHECSRDISTKMFKPKLFTKNMSNLTIKVQVENRVALAYLFKGMQQTPDSKLPQNVFLKITKF